MDARNSPAASLFDSPSTSCPPKKQGAACPGAVKGRGWWQGAGGIPQRPQGAPHCAGLRTLGVGQLQAVICCCVSARRVHVSCNLLGVLMTDGPSSLAALTNTQKLKRQIKNEALESKPGLQAMLLTWLLSRDKFI